MSEEVLLLGTLECWRICDFDHRVHPHILVQRSLVSDPPCVFSNTQQCATFFRPHVLIACCCAAFVDTFVHHARVRNAGVPMFFCNSFCRCGPWTRQPGGQWFDSSIATEPWRPCDTVHPDHCARPMLWLHSSYTVKASDTSAHVHARVMVMIARLAVGDFPHGFESQTFRSYGWNTANVVPPAPSAFIVSCGSLRELDDTDAALMDVDGTEYADVQAELGGAARVVRGCWTPILPPVRWAAEADWPDFLTAGTLHFQEVENPHQVKTLQRLRAWTSQDSGPLPLQVSLLRKSRPSRVCSLRAKRRQLFRLFSRRSQPQERLPFGATTPRRGQSPLYRGRSSPLDGTAQEMYHLGGNYYSFDALQAYCFGINIKL